MLADLRACPRLQAAPLQAALADAAAEEWAEAWDRSLAQVGGRALAGAPTSFRAHLADCV